MNTYQPKEDTSPTQSITGRHIMDKLGDSQRKRIEEAKLQKKLGSGLLYRTPESVSASHKRGDTLYGLAPIDAVARLGAAFSTLGVAEHATGFYENALEGYRSSKDKDGEATILMSLAQIYWKNDDADKAIEMYQQASELYYVLRRFTEQAAALNCIGLVHASQHRYQEAVNFHEQALSILYDTGDQISEAATLDVLGMAQRRLKQFNEALNAHLNALVLRRDIGDAMGEACSQHALALVHEEMGNTDRAILFYEAALGVRKRFGDRSGELVTSYNLAKMYDRLGHFDLAETLMMRVVELEKMLDHPDLAKDEAELSELRLRLRAHRQHPNDVVVADMYATQTNLRVPAALKSST